MASRQHGGFGIRTALVACVFLLAGSARAQNSQYVFDANGNLLAQTAEVTALPHITGQPQNQIVEPGAAASFCVVAADTRGLSCQWRFNGIPLGGSATNDALLLQNVSTNNEGQYRVVLTNPSGSVTSAPAMLWIDSNGNGLPDSWELAFFGNLTNNATGDFDHDGSSNLQEFLDGTNPTNSASVLFHLTVLSDGGSVAILPDQSTYTNGQTVTLTATASSNETFHAWLGDIVTRSNPVTLIMTSNKTVYARFTPVVFTWTNLAGGDWNVATNWTPNLVPGSNDSVIIDTAVINNNSAIGITVTLDTPADCAELTLSGAPTVSGSGTLTVRGNFLWAGGTMSGGGRTVVAPGATLNIANANGVSLSTRTLENGGTVLWTGNGGITMNFGAVITNRPGNLWDIRNTGNFGAAFAPNRIDNAGTFRTPANAGTTTVSSAISFNNSGTVEIQAGTLLCNGGFTNTGAVNLSTGATNRLAGGGSATGVFTAPATALVEWTGGTFTLSPGAQLSGGGLYKLNGGSVTADANLTAENLDLIHSGSTLGGTGTVTVAGAMTWTAGTMSGIGRTIISPGATLNAAIPSLAILSGRTLENGGTVVFTGAGSLAVQSSAVITNRPGALFRIENENASGLGGGFTSGRFDNAGTFRKSAGSGTSTVSSGLSFNNSSAVEIQTGTLRLAGGGSATATFDAPVTTIMEWTGGTFTLNPGAQLNGAGLYRLNGGNLTVNEDLIVSNLDLVSSSSTLSGSGAVTVATAMTWTAGTMSGGGRTIIAPGATLNLSAPSGVNLTSRTLENGGTVLWTGAGGVDLLNGVITNRPAALFHAQNAAVLVSDGGACRLDNGGTFRKSVSAGTTTIGSGINLNNSGTVEIQTGTLLCTGGFTNTGAVTLSAGTTNRLGAGGAGSGTFTAPASSLVEWTGGTFTLNSGAQLNGSGLYKLNGGNVNTDVPLTVQNLDVVSSSSTLGGTGTVTVATAMTWTAGAMSGGGRTIIAPGATLNLSTPSGVNLTSRTLENGGTVLWTGAGGVSLLNGVITNRPAALFHAQNAAVLVSDGGACRLDNGGTFRKSISAGTTTIGSGVNFNNSGAMEIQAGTLLCIGVFTNNGVVTLSAGATNRLANGGSATGTFSAPATALVEWTATTFTLNPGAQLNGSGLYKLNGGSVNADGPLTAENLDVVSSSSTWGGTGTVTVATAMNWTAGTMGGGGRTIIGPGAMMNLGSSSSATLSSRTVENAGTVLWTGSGGVVLAPGVITNRPGALFHAQNAAQISLGFSSGRFDNAGTFRKSVSSGTTTVQSGVSFTNYGTVDIRSGVLAANGGYVSASNALLNSALGGTTAGTNYGQLQVAGTVTLNGGLSADLLPGFSPAINDTFTVLTAGSRSSAFGSFSYPSNRVTMLLSNSTTSVILRVTDVLPIPQPVLLTPQFLGSNVLLTWTATSNVTYRLENNPAIDSSNWTPLAGDVTTLSNTATKLDVVTPTNRFYRVRVLP